MLDFEAFDEIDDEFSERRLIFDGGLDEDGVVWGFGGSGFRAAVGCGDIVVGSGGVGIIHKHIITLLLDIWRKVV